MMAAPLRASAAGAPVLSSGMRHDLVGRRIRLDAERGVGEEPDLGDRRLLQLAVRAAMHIVLPNREIALLRQRVGNRARIAAAECLKLVR